MQDVNSAPDDVLVAVMANAHIFGFASVSSRWKRLTKDAIVLSLRTDPLGRYCCPQVTAEKALNKREVVRAIYRGVMALEEEKRREVICMVPLSRFAPYCLALKIEYLLIRYVERADKIPDWPGFSWKDRALTAVQGFAGVRLCQIGQWERGFQLIPGMGKSFGLWDEMRREVALHMAGEGGIFNAANVAGTMSNGGNMAECLRMAVHRKQWKAIDQVMSCLGSSVISGSVPRRDEFLCEMAVQALRDGELEKALEFKKKVPQMSVSLRRELVDYYLLHGEVDKAWKVQEEKCRGEKTWHICRDFAYIEWHLGRPPTPEVYCLLGQQLSRILILLGRGEFAKIHKEIKALQHNYDGLVEEILLEICRQAGKRGQFEDAWKFILHLEGRLKKQCLAREVLFQAERAGKEPVTDKEILAHRLILELLQRKSSVMGPEMAMVHDLAKQGRVSEVVDQIELQQNDEAVFHLMSGHRISFPLPVVSYLDSVINCT